MTRNRRLSVILILLHIWAVLVIWKLGALQLLSGERYANYINRTSQITIDEIPRRGNILDREGRILAMSVSVPSICAYPPFIQDPEEVADILAPILKTDPEKLKIKMSADRQFAWLARQVEPAKGDVIFHKRIRGIGVRYEYRRIYPYGTMAGKILGTVGVDHQGLAGLEYIWNKHLAGERGKRIMLKDARRNDLDLNLLVREPVAGGDLKTSLDMVMQHFAEKEIRNALRISSFRAMSITAMDPRNGEIFAHAIYPASDPGSANTFFKNSEPDWLAKGVYEPGSTLKPLVAALALEYSLSDLDEIFHGYQGKIECNNKIIHDHEPFGDLSLEEAIVHSSNVIFAQLGLRLSPDSFHAGLIRMGFGSRTGIDLPGEESGILHAPEHWNINSPAYMALGQELAVTNAQLLKAYSALTGEGTAFTPHFNLDNNYAACSILSDRVVHMLRPVLREVTKSGTGTGASISLCSVAGKTGTAQKPFPGSGYAPGKYISSFIGWFPVNQPRIMILVMMDEPEGQFYGGEVAAPIFSRLANALCIAEKIYET